MKRFDVQLEDVSPLNKAGVARQRAQDVSRAAHNIVEAVSKVQGIRVAAILGRSRLRPVVRARHEVWRILRYDYGWSLPAIACVFGVDHTTVLSATREHVRALHRGPRLRIVDGRLVRLDDELSNEVQEEGLEERHVDSKRAMG